MVLRKFRSDATITAPASATAAAANSRTIITAISVAVLAAHLSGKQIDDCRRHNQHYLLLVAAR